MCQSLLYRLRNHNFPGTVPVTAENFSAIFEMSKHAPESSRPQSPSEASSHFISPSSFEERAEVAAKPTDTFACGRSTSHYDASTSPRCAFSWILDYARRLNRDPSSTPYADFFTTLQVPLPSLKHVIGKGGRTLAKIEDLAQCMINVFDCGEQMAVVNFCGDSSGLGRFLVSALGHGHYSVLSTLQRNGIFSS